MIGSPYDTQLSKESQAIVKMLRKQGDKQRKEGEKKRLKVKMETTQQFAQKRMRTVASGNTAVMAKSVKEAMKASKVAMLVFLSIPALSRL